MVLAEGFCLNEALKRMIGALHVYGKDGNMSDKPVKIFSLSTCSHCKSTKRLLDECTIQYDFVDVDLLEGEERKAILEDVKKFNPRCSFPTVVIGDTVVVGYKEDKIKEALGL